MKNARRLRILATLLALAATAAVGASAPPSSGEHWQITGTLTEACTCAVPCTCNFSEGPSPHHYCYSLYSLGIEKGHYGSVREPSNRRRCLRHRLPKSLKLWAKLRPNSASSSMPFRRTKCATFTPRSAASSIRPSAIRPSWSSTASPSSASRSPRRRRTLERPFEPHAWREKHFEIPSRLIRFHALH